MKNKKIIMLGSVIVTILVLFVTVGYSAFNAVVDVKDLSMHIRPDKDIRITNVTLGENSGVNGGLSYNEDWTKQTVFGDISLPNSNSSIKYTVEVKNLGFVDMMINSITLPTSLQSKLNVTVSNYTLGDTIAHGTQTMDVTLSYKSGQYVSSSTLFNNIVLTFDFQEPKPHYMCNLSKIDSLGGFDKNMVESISFATTNVVPSDALGYFDISQDNDGSVMAWYYDKDNNITITSYDISSKDYYREVYISYASDNYCSEEYVLSDMWVYEYNGLSSFLGGDISEKTMTSLIDKIYNSKRVDPVIKDYKNEYSYRVECDNNGDNYSLIFEDFSENELMVKKIEKENIKFAVYEILNVKDYLKGLV